jgi:hypothetical protein
LPIGVYYRPSSSQVSGTIDASTTFARSPCPALNTLANHGFLPRDGKHIKKEDYVSVIKAMFSLDDWLAHWFAHQLPSVSSLSDLGKHNFIEHDFSVVHKDAYFQRDPSEVDAAMAADLIGRGFKGVNGTVLSVQQLGDVSVTRMAACKAKPTGCDLNLFQRDLAFREQASILRVFGGDNGESCRIEFAQSFLVDERFPDGWRKPTKQVSHADLSVTAVKIENAMKP